MCNGMTEIGHVSLDMFSMSTDPFLEQLFSYYETEHKLSDPIHNKYITLMENMFIRYSARCKHVYTSLS